LFFFTINPNGDLKEKKKHHLPFRGVQRFFSFAPWGKTIKIVFFAINPRRGFKREKKSPVQKVVKN
jgi:hypothetical protein